MVHYGTMAEIYQQQIEYEQRVKQEAHDQAACNIIGLAYRNDWPKEDLIMTLQALGLDDEWIGEKIASATGAATEA